MNNTTKNQHYIPQSILKNFSNDKNQVFEAIVTKKKIYPTNYRNSMSERYTYESPLLENNQLEKLFGEIESYLAPGIRKIIEMIDLETDISEIKRAVENYMKEFIIFYYRSGALLSEFSVQKFSEDDKIPLMIEKIADTSYLEKLVNTIINHYEFFIIKSENEEFLMSDQYISTAALGIKGRFSNFSNRHMGMKDTIILIPLSNKYYAVFTNGNHPVYECEKDIKVLNMEEIKNVNKVIMNNSYNKCIATKKQQLEESIQHFSENPVARSMVIYESGLNIHSIQKKEVFYWDHDNLLWEYITNPKYFFPKTNRNDKCPCQSGLKYKKCCQSNIDKARNIIHDMYRKNHRFLKCHPSAVLEKPIDEFYSLIVTGNSVKEEGF